MKNHLNKIYLLLLVALLFNFQQTNSQNLQLNFRNYSLKDGLSSGTVYSILKDRFGFIWLATDDGLNRFDGSSFRVFRHDPTNPAGLKVNHITSLYEDKNGRLWIGTNGGGLCYYDGNKDAIVNFTTKEENQVGVAVTDICGDKAGNIMVSCFGGLFQIDINTNELIIGSKATKLIKAVNGMVVLSFFEDSRRRKWTTTNTGLFLLSPSNNKITVFRHQENDAASVTRDVNKIVEDSLGNIWVAGENGISMLLPNEKGFKNYTVNSAPAQLSSNTVHAFKADSKNRLWIGTDEGLDILDIGSNTISTHVPDDRNPASLNSRSIRSIFVDPTGIYWIGSFRGGLHKFDENYNHFSLKEYRPFDPFGLRSPIVTSFEFYKNNLFVGTDGGGLQLYHPGTGLLDHISLPVASKNNKHDLSILSMEMGDNDRLWIGTFNQGLFNYNPENKSLVTYSKGTTPSDLNSNDVFCIKEDRKGNTWVGTNGGGINVIRSESKIIDKYVLDPLSPNDPSRPLSNYIRCFEEDSLGHIWVGTFGSGISVYDPATQLFSFFTKANSDLPSDYIMAIKQDSKGNIWIGTSGNGLGLLKRGTSNFIAITEKDGLINGNIQTIIEDDSGKLWISTNNGISCYDPATKKFKNYTSHNGLQAGAFMPRAGIKLPGGELYFGGQNGFNHFNPASFKTNKNIPQVVFTGLMVDNKAAEPSEKGAIHQSILLADEVKLRYGQTFSISFEALDFTVPEANQYQYMLKGFDKSWVSAGKEHRAYYAKIPPGNYVFTVRASNNDGLWNTAGQSVNLVVAPPLWRSNWAYFAYLLLLVGLVLYTRHRGIQKIQMRYALEHERKEAKQLIERERQEAEYLHKLDQTKIKFLTNLSHEFRTPISLIIGPVDSLIGRIKEESLLNQLNLIKRNSKRLLNLVNQLLDFRKMEERELKLQCVEDDIIPFIQDICNSFNDIAKLKKIEFGFYSEIKTLQVLFDQDKIERVLFNLLSNAFKFTPENGNIAVTLKESSKQPVQDFALVTISVKDSGIGIPKEALEKVFESFFQHDKGPEIMNHGTGIGLAITREFVQIHNGTIWVDSEVGKGSTFTFQLKLMRASINVQDPTPEIITPDQLPVAANTGSHDMAGTSQPSILIIEDDDDFRFYIKDNLKHSYRIFEAANGKDGWQRALFHHPDIIVCDVQMPVMNGLELAQKLKADKRTKHIPIIMLTAGNTPNGTLDGLESGAIDYMTKPFNFAVLQAKIHNILLLNQSFKDTYSKQVSVTLPETEVISEEEKFLQKTLSYIYQNLKNPQLSVEILSEHMKISRASLYNRLLEYTGMSPVEFIRSVKLEKAKDLLEKTDSSVTDIANETGFANPNYFTKVFKTKYHITPSEFVAEKKRKEQLFAGNS
ncbi:MAG: two-component regulator propeller domain-containing protein [Bacteroidota bacterium]